MRLIKRYNNRRLYDMTESRTITQADLAELVKQGEEVRVVENSTGEDITLLVLGRTLVDQSIHWQNASESKKLLSEIIAIGGDKSMSILRNTILASIGAFEVTKTKAEKIVDELIKKGELSKTDRKKAVMEVLEKAEKSTVKIREKVAKETTHIRDSVSKTVKELKLVKQADLAKLEKKIDKLSRSIASLEKKL